MMNRLAKRLGWGTDHLMALGVALGAFYWALESFLDSFAFHMGTLSERLFAPDANELWMRLLVIGVLVLFSGYAQGALTERRRAGEALQGRTALFEGLFESAPDAVLVVNRQGRIQRVNRQAETMFGYPRAELLDRPIEVLLPQDVRESHARYCARYAAEPRLHPMGAGLDICARRRDGTAFPVDIMLSHLETGDDVVVLCVVRDITERKRADRAMREYAERLQTLSHRLVEVQESERRHLARELHDEIGQLLTGLKLTLETGARSPAGEVNNDRLSDAQALVNDLMTRVRQLSLDLRPAMLDDLGLLPTLLWHFQRYTDQTQVEVSFRHSGLEGRRFAPDVETTVYRLVQEALTNVARHAGVNQVTVRLWTDQSSLNVQVEDEGIGFDPEARLRTGASSGLAGMHERAGLLGGHIAVESASRAGTRVNVELPLTPE